MTVSNFMDSFSSQDSKCNKCYFNVDLNNSIINNKRQLYHTQCLTCSECNQEISYNYYNQNGQPICLNCKLINAKDCTVCAQKIFGDSYTFDHKMYHNNCFRCRQCMRLLKGRKLLLDMSGEPSCAECLYKSNKQNEKRCAGCTRPLSETKSICKTFEGEHFHTDCMKCQDCRIQLSPEDKYFRSGNQNTKFICVDCGLRRILNRITKLFTKI